MTRGHILVADEHNDTRDALAMILRRAGYMVLTAASEAETCDGLQRHQVDVLLCDIALLRRDACAILHHGTGEAAGVVLVLMLESHDTAVAIDAMQHGAFDYLLKPLRKDQVLRTVQKAIVVRELLQENRELRHQVSDHGMDAQIIGSSPAWRWVCELVAQVAPLQLPVLLTGERGTGKELLASLLHRLSPRAAYPFIVLNVATFPATLLEAALFGTEESGDPGTRPYAMGHMELAGRGTLLLDEIGDMLPDMQMQCWRVLQEGTFQRYAGTHALRAEARVVATTSKNLAQEVEAQRFHPGLYAHLSRMTIRIPPLRERRQDIPLLATHFMEKYAQKHYKKVIDIHPDVLQHFQIYGWPGNVRELENTIERAVVLTRGPTITVADLVLEEQSESSVLPSGEYCVVPTNTTIAQVERAMIVQALHRSAGNRQAAARQLGIGVSTLYRKLKEYRLL